VQPCAVAESPLWTCRIDELLTESAEHRLTLPLTDCLIVLLGSNVHSGSGSLFTPTTLAGDVRDGR
jgi:hypothetical protein